MRPCPQGARGKGEDRLLCESQWREAVEEQVGAANTRRERRGDLTAETVRCIGQRGCVRSRPTRAEPVHLGEQWLLRPAGRPARLTLSR